MGLVLYEDFQSFSVGDPGPYGALTVAPGAIAVAISNTAGADGTQGPYGKARYLFGQAGTVYFDDATSRANLSIFVAFRPPGLPDLGNLLELNTFVPGGFGQIQVFALTIAPDSTLVPLYRANPIGAPGDFVFSTGNWTYIQLNIAFAAIAGPGTPFSITWDVWIDGKADISGTFNSPGLGPNLGAVDQIFFGGYGPGLNGCQFGEISIYDTIQAKPFFPNPGTSLARSTNQVIEVMLVAGAPPPLGASCPLNTAVVGVPYSEFVNVAGGVPPYTFALTGGSLPTGLSLNTSTGEISGTPTVTGPFTYEITVTDADLTDVIIDCGITVADAGATCPVGSVAFGAVYSHAVVVVGGTPPYTFSIIAGALPPGWSIDPTTGVISGTATVSGTYNYTVQIEDSLANIITIDCQIIVGTISPCNQSLISQI